MKKAYFQTVFLIEEKIKKGPWQILIIRFRKFDEPEWIWYEDFALLDSENNEIIFEKYSKAVAEGIKIARKCNVPYMRDGFMYSLPDEHDPFIEVLDKNICSKCKYYDADRYLKYSSYCEDEVESNCLLMEIDRIDNIIKIGRIPKGCPYELELTL